VKIFAYPNRFQNKGSSKEVKVQFRIATNDTLFLMNELLHCIIYDHDNVDPGTDKDIKFSKVKAACRINYS
jgi:hypothetical protein